MNSWRKVVADLEEEVPKIAKALEQAAPLLAQMQAAEPTLKQLHTFMGSDSWLNLRRALPKDVTLERLVSYLKEAQQALLLYFCKWRLHALHLKFKLGFHFSEFAPQNKAGGR